MVARLVRCFQEWVLRKLRFQALCRDEEKIHTYRGSQVAKTSIDVYSCSGKLIRRINVYHYATTWSNLSADSYIQWDKGSIRGLGWSEDEKLLIVTKDGSVRCYYDLQGDFTQFSLGNVSAASTYINRFSLKSQEIGCRGIWSHFLPILV